MKIVALLLLNLLTAFGYREHYQRKSDSCVNLNDKAELDLAVKFLTHVDDTSKEPYFIYGKNNGAILPEDFPVHQAILNIEGRKGNLQFPSVSAKLKSCQDDCILSEDTKDNLKLDCN